MSVLIIISTESCIMYFKYMSNYTIVMLMLQFSTIKI